jgi:hypothetical protein
MMKLLAFALVAVASAESVLEFKDASDVVCAITKNGDSLDITNCDLKFPSHSEGIEALTSGHATSISDLSAAVDNLKDKFTYLNKACPAGINGAKAGVGVNTNYLKSNGKAHVFGENLEIGCLPGYVPDTRTLRCHFDGWYESDGVTKATKSSEPTCVAYKCPAESLTYGGAKVNFPATLNRHLNPNGYIQTKPCPSSHHGSITRRCHYNSDTWSATEGNCQEKKCHHHLHGPHFHC